MKYGYSIHTGETIEAEITEYGDCKRFQIVCPNCREYLFKVVREEPIVEHHFSHYRRTKAYVDECELRVGALDPRDIDRANIVSRGQKLQLVLRVLKEAIIDYCYDSRDIALRCLRPVLRSKAVHRIGRRVWAEARLRPEDFDLPVERLEKEIRDAPSALSRDLSLRIAGDLWRTLLTESGRGNFDFLFAHGYVQASGSLAIKEPRTPESERIEDFLDTLLRLPRERGLELIATEELPGGCFWDALNLVITWSVNTLVSLPYLKLFEQARR